MTVWAARARSGSFAHARSPASAAYPRVAQDDKLGVWAAPGAPHLPASGRCGPVFTPRIAGQASTHVC